MRIASFFPTVICLLLLLGRISLSAASPVLESDFQQANKLYEEGKYREAVMAYQKLIQTGDYSAPLLFNLGNAFYKSAEFGRARACYWLAREIDPRDAATQANLRLISQSAGPEPGTWWERLIGLLRWFSLNEWTIVMAAGIWIWLGLLTTGQLRPDWVPHMRRYKILFTLVLVGIGIGFALTVYDRCVVRAVMVQPQAEVRRGPIQESQVFYTLANGSAVRILDQQDDWLQIADYTSRPGWLLGHQLVVLRPGVLSTNLFLR
jgi:tetratricopeptide (TPR) repeat protein